MARKRESTNKTETIPKKKWTPSDVEVVTMHAACWRRRGLGAVIALSLGGPLSADVGGCQLEPGLVESDVECGCVFCELLHDREVGRILQERNVRGQPEDGVLRSVGGAPLILPSWPHMNLPTVAGRIQALDEEL